jgi:hypothetical protein
MKFNFALFFILISLTSNSQNSFEGVIYFNLKFTSKDSIKSVRIDQENKYKLKEGDSIKILYSKFGHIKHQYLNSGESGIDYYLILSNGTRYRKLKSGSIDNPSTKVKFLGKFKAENQIVMGISCECYQYQYKTSRKKSITETFCFSKSSPMIDYKLFGMDSNIADKDFFETAQRPFLKYTIESSDYKIEQTAYKLEFEKIPIEEFK